MSPRFECRSSTTARRPRMVRRSSAGSTRSSALLLRLAFVVAICGPMSANAQDTTAARDSTAPPREGWIVGPLIGVPAAGGEVFSEIATIGLSFTRLNPGWVGADLSVGTVPRALANGFAAFGFRADAAYPVSLTPNLLLLPAAGLSVIGALGDGGGGGAMGINAGIGVVLHGKSPAGLRLEATVHQLSASNAAIFLLEAGVVSVPTLVRR